MSSSGYPADFHKSPEPLPSPRTAAVREEEDSFQQQPLQLDHQFHLLQQIREDQVSIGGVAKNKDPTKDTYFEPYYTLSKLVYHLSRHIFQPEEYAVATWMGFWGLLAVTCANFVLSPMRDAAALQVGVQHIPRLTLASSLLAFLSSVPIGWLFEAPDPKRRKVWKTMGLTRGETQGTSLALFYRCFALCVLCYAVGFKAVDSSWSWIPQWLRISFQYTTTAEEKSANDIVSVVLTWIQTMLGQLGQLMYIAFFLVIHLMKLHSLSLIWGVASEAMEYEDVARKKGKEMALRRPSSRDIPSPIDKSSTRLQRLALLSFGGTLGGILGRYVLRQCLNLVCAYVFFSVSLPNRTQ